MWVARLFKAAACSGFSNKLVLVSLSPASGVATESQGKTKHETPPCPQNTVPFAI